MRKGLRHDFAEGSVMFVSMVKWVALAIFIGIIVGGTTAGFIKLLHISCDFTSNKFKYYYLFMPLAFFLSSFIIIKIAPDAEGHGTEKVIQAVHQRDGKIDLKVVPIKVITTIITIMFGGSAGEEGPCAQVGGGLASFISGLFKMDKTDRKKIVVCGVSAGFAAVLGTPISSAVFAAEVLYVGKFSYTVLLPSLIASYVSCFVNEFLGLRHPVYSIDFTSTSNIKMFVSMIVFGLFIGVVAMFFIRILTIIESFFAERLNIYKPLKGLIGGIIIVAIVFIFGGNTNFIGLGSNITNGAIDGNSVGMGEFLIKMITTSVTLGSGGSGGILTPMFYIGSTAGNTWGQLVNGNVGLYSAIGMVAFLAACSNTPLAAIIMAMEMFGVEAASFASIACVISYLMVGHRSVYPTQILSVSKSASLAIDEDCEICEVNKLKVSGKSRMVQKFANKVSKKEKV